MQRKLRAQGHHGNIHIMNTPKHMHQTCSSRTSSIMLSLFLRMRSRRTGTALSGRVPPGAAEDGVTKSDNLIAPRKNEPLRRRRGPESAASPLTGRRNLVCEPRQAPRCWTLGRCPVVGRCAPPGLPKPIKRNTLYTLRCRPSHNSTVFVFHAKQCHKFPLQYQANRTSPTACMVTKVHL